MHVVCLAYGTINKYIDDANAVDAFPSGDHKIINSLSAIQLAMTFVIKHFKRYTIKPSQNS